MFSLRNEAIRHPLLFSFRIASGYRPRNDVETDNLNVRRQITKDTLG